MGDNLEKITLALIMQILSVNINFNPLHCSLMLLLYAVGTAAFSHFSHSSLSAVPMEIMENNSCV
jgi:hypothetical protein